MLQNKHGIGRIYAILRKMAKTSKYQTLYASSKEGCVNLFKNIATYTDLQIAFLQYLAFYNSINIDIYMNEVDELVLDNEIYEDAYQYYKNKEKSKKNKNLKTPQQQKKQNQNQKKATTVSNTHVVFSKQNVKQAVQNLGRRK